MARKKHDMGKLVWFGAPAILAGIGIAPIAAITIGAVAVGSYVAGKMSTKR